MKTKEAIEEITDICWAANSNDILSEKVRDDIITLLKQGEAYRRMWEELYVIHGNTIVDDIASLNNVMEIMEQKYLIKKEAKQNEINSTEKEEA